MFPKSKRWDQKFKIFMVCSFLYAIAFNGNVALTRKRGLKFDQILVLTTFLFYEKDKIQIKSSIMPSA